MHPASLTKVLFSSALITSILCSDALAKVGGKLLAIDNEQLILRLDKENSSFEITSKQVRNLSVKRGILSAPPDTVTVSESTSSKWGSGKTIKCVAEDGSITTFSLYADAPYVLVDSYLSNPSQEEIIHKNYTPLTFEVVMPQSDVKDKAFGSFGLDRIERRSNTTNGLGNTGSHTFISIVNPESRSGLVAASLSQDRGSCVFFTTPKGDATVIKPRIDFGKLLIDPGKKEKTETLAIGLFEDVRLGLEQYADMVAKHYDINLPPQPTVYCTWYHAKASNEKELARNGKFARQELAPYGFSVMQIDDLWQDGIENNGPKKNFTRIDPDGPYKSGMKQAADRIKEQDLVPGIWLIPFSGTLDDPFFADKQDLFVKRPDGKPYDTDWNGTCLDMTNPVTKKYVYDIARRMAEDWGFKYFKLDGIASGLGVDVTYPAYGYKDDRIGDAVLHDPHKTQVEAYRDGLKLFRDAIGQDAFILGCHLAQNQRAFGGSFGLVDAMRIANDNGPYRAPKPGWDSWGRMTIGTRHGAKLFFCHGRIWYNDPDPIYVKELVPQQQAKTYLSWVTLTGGLNATSIDYTSLPPGRLELLKRSMPSHGLSPRPVDLFEQEKPRIWLLTDQRTNVRRDVIGLFNWERNLSAKFDYSLERIGLSADKSYVGYDFWGDKFIAPFKGSVVADVPAESCLIMALKPVSDAPQVISTSRHVTQGIIDIVEENWNESTATLSGKSHVVAGDPYEIRIALPNESSQATSAALVAINGAETNAEIGVVSNEKTGAKVVITSEQSGVVAWEIIFSRSGS